MVRRDFTGSVSCYRTRSPCFQNTNEKDHTASDENELYRNVKYEMRHADNDDYISDEVELQRNIK